MSIAMSADERAAFLADVHVGLLSVSDREGRGPLLMPLWYRYVPGGDVRIITGGESRKTRLIRETGRCSLCVQSEELPYRYVTVEGPVTIEQPVDREERRAMAARYLGEEAADAYLAATESAAEGEVVLRLRPEHWFSADYAKLNFD